MQCIDSLSFKFEGSTTSFGCDARSGTGIPSYNTFAKTWTITSPSEYFVGFYLETWADCQIDYITAKKGDLCSSQPTSLISLDASAIDGLSQSINTGSNQIKTVIASSPCSNVEYSLIITPTPATTNLITLTTGTSPTITFAASTNSLDANAYSVTLRARFTGQTSWTKTNGPFTYSYVDPCKTSTLLWPIPGLSSMTTSLLFGGGPVTQTANPIKDQYSVTFGDVTGTQFCGARKFTISSVVTATATQNLSVTDLSIDAVTGVISLLSATNPATVGTHTATVVGKLENYFPIVALVSAQFTITINPCIVTNLAMTNLSPGKDIEYILNYPVQTQNVLGTSVTQTPSCEYKVSLSLASSSNTFISTAYDPIIPTLTLNVYSQTKAHIGVHIIQVDATLLDYVFTPSISVPIVSETLQVTITDECLLTSISVISPSSIENLVTFAGYSVNSTVQYSFNDTVSFVRTLITDQEDYCGEKVLTFFINNTVTELLITKTQDFISFSPPKGTKTLGVGQASVLIQMQNYALIPSSSLTFTATILDVKAPLIEDQVYLQSSSPLEIYYEPFQILPDGYNPGPSWVQVYVSSQTPDKFDIDSSSLTPSSALDWITHDEVAGLVAIQTYNSANVGEHSILVVQFFDLFPDVHPFSAFKLTINALPVFIAPTIRKAPYLATPLVQQNVTQCPGFKSDLWSFVLPKPIDPNNKEVTIKVAFDATFFKYEATTQTIKQLQVVQKPVNQTLYVTLSNEFDLKGTYSMRVEFSCNKTSDFVFNFSNAVFFDKVKRQTYWPQAKISQIEPSGLMHVRFNRLMKIPDHPELIQNDTVMLNDTIFPIIKLEVLPGKYSDKNNLKFNWTFKEFNPTELLIQLSFESPNFVSSQKTDLDFIRLTFYGFQYFSDNLGNYMLPPTITNSKSLPQMASADKIAAAQSLASTTSNVINSVMIANTFATIAIAGPLQQILNSVKQLQIVVHIFLINVAYPAAVPLIFGVLMNLLTFQVIELQDFYNKILRLDSDSEGNQPINDQFDLMGYSSRYIIQNFGTLMLTFAALLTAMALSPLGSRLFKNRLVWIRHKLRNFGFTNYWLRFFNDTYLFLAVCTALNFGYFKWGSYGETLNTLMALMFAVLLVLFTTFVILFYRRKQNYNNILERDEEFLNRFGSVIEGLNFKRKGKEVLIYVVTVLIRKLSFAYLLVFQYKKPVFNIFAVTLQALLVIGVSGTIEPMADRAANILDLINESFVLIFTYHLYPLTDFVTDFQTRDYVGKSLVLLALLNITINLGTVTIRNIGDFVRKMKLKRLQWKQARAIQKRKEERLKLYAKRQESAMIGSNQQQPSNQRPHKTRQQEESESESEYSSFQFDSNEQNSQVEEVKESECDFYAYLRRQALPQRPRILQVGDVVYLQDSESEEVYGRQLEMKQDQENYLYRVNQTFEPIEDSYQFEMPNEWKNLPENGSMFERERLRKERETDKQAIDFRQSNLTTHQINIGSKMYDLNQPQLGIGAKGIQRDEEAYPSQLDKPEEMKNENHWHVNQPIGQYNQIKGIGKIGITNRNVQIMERETINKKDQNGCTDQFDRYEPPQQLEQSSLDGHANKTFPIPGDIIENYHFSAEQQLPKANKSYLRFQQPTHGAVSEDPSIKYGFPATKSGSSPNIPQNEAHLISVKTKPVHSLLFQQMFAQKQQVSPAQKVELSPRSFKSPLQQLTEMFPGVQVNILSIRKSEIYGKVIEVREVKYSGRVIRYSVLSDGSEVNQFLVRKHFDATGVQTQQQNAEDRALELTKDCPWWVKIDIVSGKFQRELDQYKIARQQFVRQGWAEGYTAFTDFGECDSFMDMNQRIRLYLQVQQLKEAR